MKNTIFHLPTCNTCKKIIAGLNNGDRFVMRDIKGDAMTEAEVDYMAKKAGSYEAIFTRRSRKYRAMNLHEQTLTEADYKRLILEEYTFLKRPVIIIDDEVFVGNAKKTIEAAQQKLAGA